MSLTLVGLGVKAGDISLEALSAVQAAEKVILKTDMTANYPIFEQYGITVTTMDHVYQRSRNFDTLCRNVAAEVFSASKGCNAVYCVDGSVLEDNACKLILQKHRDVKVISGVSKVSSCMEGLGIAGSYSAVSAYDVHTLEPNGGLLCVYDMDSSYLAGEVKLRLMDIYGDECPCLLFCGGEKYSVALYEIDRMERYDYTTALVVTPNSFLNKNAYTFNDLCTLITMLRGENGCPWDRAQTHESIRINAIEEVYELVDAIDRCDDERLTEEIGDCLMQAVFHTQLAEDRGALTQGEVLTGVCKKLISRHTHIFFGDKASDEAQALDVWEKNKQKEHGYSLKGAVRDVPSCFPALLRTEKVIKRASKAGWETGDKESAEQEINRLCGELISCEEGEVMRVLGDLLFACVNLGRMRGGECEIALKDKTEQFVKEFAGDEE
ncbi:MAG: MazG family protein [Clostridia bacterium]|nr:MazG family protein [Clostridia bacterium]